MGGKKKQQPEAAKSSGSNETGILAASTSEPFGLEDAQMEREQSMEVHGRQGQSPQKTSGGRVGNSDEEEDKHATREEEPSSPGSPTASQINAVKNSSIVSFVDVDEMENSSNTAAEGNSPKLPQAHEQGGTSGDDTSREGSLRQQNRHSKNIATRKLGKSSSPESSQNRNQDNDPFGSSTPKTAGVGNSSFASNTSKASNNSAESSRTGGGRSAATAGDFGTEGSVDFSETFDVGVHVYDLTKGFAAKHSQALVGHEGLEGMLHSGVVVYGFEYYFEGGVQRSPKGHTRFGSDYKYVYVGLSHTPQHEFEAWLRDQVPLRFSLCHYRTADHNCHHFSDAVCRWLCGEPAPEYLLKNTKELAESTPGQVLLPLMNRLTGGIQYELAKQLKKHEAQRKVATTRRLMAKRHARVEYSPPAALFLYRTSPKLAKEGIEWIADAHCYQEDDFTVTLSTKMAVKRAADVISANMDPAVSQHGQMKHIDEYDLDHLLEILAKTAEVKEDWAVSRVLFAWQVAALSTQFVGTAVWNKKLNLSLMRYAFGFHRLPPSAQVNLLRLLCNYCGCPHGAALVVDGRRVDRWIAMLGNVLTSPNEILRCHGASLLCNMCFALVTLIKGTITEEIDKDGSDHASVKLFILALYHIHRPNNDDTLHRLLLALYRLLLVGGALSNYVGDHLNIPLDMEGVIAQCKTKETRSLLTQVQFLLEIGDYVTKKGGGKEEGVQREEGEEQGAKATSESHFGPVSPLQKKGDM